MLMDWRFIESQKGTFPAEHSRHTRTQTLGRPSVAIFRGFHQRNRRAGAHIRTEKCAAGHAFGSSAQRLCVIEKALTEALAEN